MIRVRVGVRGSEYRSLRVRGHAASKKKAEVCAGVTTLLVAWCLSVKKGKKPHKYVKRGRFDETVGEDSNEQLATVMVVNALLYLQKLSPENIRVRVVYES